MHNSYDADGAQLFRNEMDSYLDEYEKFLESEFKRQAVRRHLSLISFFNSELDLRYGVTGFEQITYIMCASKLVSYYKGISGETIQLQTAKNTIYKFLNFIYSKHGIANHELLKKLKK